jgi:Tfp pilus tip-associated adhesin PilY1
MDACASSDRSKRGVEDKMKSGATKTSASKASTGKKVAKKSKDSGKASKGLSAGSNSVDTSYGLERRLLSVRGNITAQVALVESLKISEVNKLLGGLPEPEMVAELLLTVGAAAEKQCESISDSEVETKWTHVINWYRAVSKSSAFGLVKNLFSAEQADSLRATLRKACDIVSAGGASGAGVSAEQCKEVLGIYATV